MSKLNPNHPVTQFVDEHWHKLCALVMFATDNPHIVITAETLREAHGCGLFITVQELEDGLHLRLVTEEQAHRLAREHGGLPQ